MPQSEILLVEHIENLGSEGDVVKVRPGYARNFLLPRGKAVPLNHANKKRLDALKIAKSNPESQRTYRMPSRLHKNLRMQVLQLPSKLALEENSLVP